MTQHTITFAAEIAVTVEADSRAEAIIKLKRCSKRADLWADLDMAKAEAGEPSEGIFDAAIRIIGRPS